MLKFKAWLAKYSITTHTLAVVFTSLTAAYSTSDVFSAYVNSTAIQIYHSLPPWMGKFVLGAVIPLFLIYRKKLSLAGQVGVGKEAFRTVGAKEALGEPLPPSVKAAIAAPAPAVVPPITPGPIKEQ